MAKTSIGIDIGTDNVKIVSLIDNGKQYKLDGYGVLGFHGDQEKLRDFIAGAAIHSKDVRINIEDASLKVRRLDLPVIPDSEMEESVKWGLRDIVEGDVEDFLFRYVKVDREDFELEKKIPLIVFAIKKSVVENVYKIAKGLGLPRPQVIEPDAGALSSIFGHLEGEKRENYNIIIDMGSFAVQLAVMGRGGLLFSRPLMGLAGGNFVDQISRDLGVSIKDAEAAKLAFLGNERTLEKTGTRVELKEETMTKLKNTYSHFCSKMALEIQRSIDGFFLLFERHKIANIYICGGGAYYPEMTSYLSKTLGINVATLDPFKKMDLSEYSVAQIEKLKAAGALYAVACGLAVDY